MKIIPPPTPPPDGLRLAAIRAGFTLLPIAPSVIDATQDVRDGLTAPDSASRRRIAPQAACNRYRAAENLGLVFFIGTAEGGRKVYGLTPEGKAVVNALRPKAAP